MVTAKSIKAGINVIIIYTNNENISSLYETREE